MKSLLLTANDTRSIVRHVGLHGLMDEMIAALTDAFRHFDPARADAPARDGFNYTVPETGLVEWMPIRVDNGTTANVTIKVVGYHPDNPARRGLPTILSTVSAYDTTTGHLISVADGVFLTSLRTGAASAVATRLLAAPESRTLGLIGCGAQAVTQLHAISRVVELERVLLYDSDPATTANFTARTAMLDLGGVVVEAAPLARVVAASDVICTATSVDIGGGPVFEDIDVRPWIHVNAVGADFPGKVEVPRSLLDRALVCPDFLAQAVKEGECQQLPLDAVGPNITAIARDPASTEAWRRRPTVFDSTGWALEDHIALEQMTRHAQILGLGTPVELENISEDPKSPYEFLTEARSFRRILPSPHRPKPANDRPNRPRPM